MLMTKIKLILAAVSFIGVAGLFVYVNHLRSENAIHVANAAVTDGVIISLREENAARKIDSDLKTGQLRKRMEQIANLTKTTANLNRELKNATRHDPKVVECLAVKPGADFVNQLRKYTQGIGDEEAGEALPGTELLPESDT